MAKLVLAAAIFLVSSLTLAHAQPMMPRPLSPYYAPYAAPYAAYVPYAPYAYGPYPYAPYYVPQQGGSKRVSRKDASRNDAAIANPGVANPGIAAVQRRLKDLGFLPGAASIDGVAGSQTQTAIANWQRSLAHPTTGLLTPAEVQALFEPPPVHGTLSPQTAAPQVSLPPTPRILGQSAAMPAQPGMTR
jgi:putative peptidoglycan binding protein